MTADSVLELRHVVKSFDGAVALRDVSCRFEAGRVYALCGLNGSGKSTLIKIITGVLQPDAGTVLLGGEAIAAAHPKGMKRGGIHAIYQDFALFPNMSVAENIAIGTIVDQPFGVLNGKAQKRQARQALDAIKAHLPLTAAVETLSTAQSQLVAIARALNGESRLLILDEPTASLTNAEAERLFDVVRDLKASGVAILFVSHRYAEVATIADEAIVLRDGSITDVFDRRTLRADDLHAAMAGDHRAEPEQVALPEPGTSTVLELRGLALEGAFQEVDLAIRKGEIVGLTGLLGSGRTALAQTVFGIHRASRGEIYLHGRRLRLRSNRVAIAAGITYVPEDRLQLGLILGASIADNIALPSRGRLTGPIGLVDRNATARFVNRLIEVMRIKLRDPADPVTSLSGGNQQRVVLAKWLGTQPGVLLLDAPTVGVDVTARRAIYQVIREVAAQGAAVLLISDEIEEVWSNTHRVHVMQAGRLGPAYDPRSISLEALADIVHG